MDPTAPHRHHYRSASAAGGDRFLSLFSYSAPPVADPISHELDEADVCFTEDFSDRASGNRRHSPSSAARRLHLTRQLQSSGLLAALPAATSSKQIPASRAVGGERDFAKTAPCRKQSAPVKVPMMTSARRRSRSAEEDDEEEEEEMLPPHEIVARRLHSSAKSTFSVLEGAGRTLKGRDLRQVRNAIWRRTGFLD